MISKLLVVTVITRVLWADVAAAASNVITPTQDGPAQISCSCITAVSACASRILNTISGQSGTTTWTQEASLNEGHPVDLSLACWRKRDVDKMGGGFCCRNSGNEDDVR